MNYPTLVLVFEDVRGLGCFNDFENIRKDFNHPEYDSYKGWSSYQGFDKLKTIISYTTIILTFLA